MNCNHHFWVFGSFLNNSPRQFQMRLLHEMRWKQKETLRVPSGLCQKFVDANVFVAQNDYFEGLRRWAPDPVISGVSYNSEKWPKIDRKKQLLVIQVSRERDGLTTPQSLNNMIPNTLGLEMWVERSPTEPAEPNQRFFGGSFDTDPHVKVWLEDASGNGRKWWFFRAHFFKSYLWGVGVVGFGLVGKLFFVGERFGTMKGDT